MTNVLPKLSEQQPLCPFALKEKEVLMTKDSLPQIVACVFTSGEMLTSTTSLINMCKHVYSFRFSKECIRGRTLRGNV